MPLKAKHINLLVVIKVMSGDHQVEFILALSYFMKIYQLIVEIFQFGPNDGPTSRQTDKAIDSPQLAWLKIMVKP